jgi:ankyrin repeat protein
MDVNAVDQQLNTPLHWAMIEQSEIACSYLLAWKPNINKQDANGQTPLHLAVKTIK